MIQNNSVRKYSLLAAMLVVVCLGAAYYLMTTLYPAYTLAKGQNANVTADNQRLKQAANAADSFLKEYERQSQNAANLSLALPATNPDMANFLGGLSNLALSSGVTLSNLEIPAGEEKLFGPENAIETQNISLKVTGNYLAFKDFILRLEEHLRLVDIYQVSLASAGAEGAGSPSLEHVIKLRTYYQR